MIVIDTIQCTERSLPLLHAVYSINVLFSYGYNKETCKIIEATFLTLHFCPIRDFSQVKWGCPKWPNGKYASVDITWKAVL